MGREKDGVSAGLEEAKAGRGRRAKKGVVASMGVGGTSGIRRKDIKLDDGGLHRLKVMVTFFKLR